MDLSTTISVILAAANCVMLLAFYMASKTHRESLILIEFACDYSDMEFLLWLRDNTYFSKHFWMNMTFRDWRQVYPERLIQLYENAGKVYEAPNVVLLKRK